jgi:integrase
MTPEEQHRFLYMAQSREEWRVVYCWALIALQTTAATNELRALRIGDVFLTQGTIQIRSEGAKNKFRVRTIPLQTPEVVWALEQLVARAHALGASGPHCYLFPFHRTQKQYDPLRPMTVWGIRRSWEAVRSAAHLDWLRPYDLRHTAITRMAEAGVPIHVIMSFAGHMSQRMQLHYTSISMAAKREWAGRTWAGTAQTPKKPAGGKRGPRASLVGPDGDGVRAMEMGTRFVSAAVLRDLDHGLRRRAWLDAERLVEAAR